MDFEESQKLHNKYYHLYDKLVCVHLKDGSQITGLFNDEFFEEASILVDCREIRICDIEKMHAVEN